jgi:hypothetical protein
MSPIDPLGPLLAQIRSQASGLRRKDAATSGAPAPAGEDGRPSPASVMDGVVAAIANLSPELPDRRRQAFRLFLKAVLANELVIEEPSASSFEDLVERVLASMEGDGRLREAIDRAGDALLDKARGRRA